MLLSIAFISLGLIQAGPVFAGQQPSGRLAAKYSESAQLDDPSIASAMADGGAISLAQEDGPRTVSVAIPGTRLRQVRLLPSGGVSAYAAPDRMLQSVGYRYRVDPKLLGAIVHAESRGRSGAISPKGALGVMQVMPATARTLGVVDPRAMLSDRGLALSTGARYLKHLQARFGNDIPLVVAAYNAGPGAVLKAGRRIPRYRETQGYVRQVVGRYAASRRTAGTAR